MHRGAASRRPSFLLRKKRGRENPLGFLPAPSSRCRPPLAGFARQEDEKIQRFDCYPSGTVILSQLGVLANLQAVFTR
jgi:hypothetical protein